KPAPIATGETITLDVDMVIKATGQKPFDTLVNENKIENNKGKIVLKENCSTNIKGIFAGGDCVNGGKEVVDAVQAGKDGAFAILKYLNV
ncbi:MAG TPA: FAD-dependent oxidoreductase, partial [Chitinophagaceae bacterium]|nr:FAD-dependent oxidoreductase [Chitinophagaceae bacterium]